MSTEAIPELEAIAIVGLAGRYPGARTIGELWKKLCDGVESISFFSEEELIDAGVDPKVARDPNYVKARGVLGDTELFDAAFFGLNPREAALMDPQHRVFLECAWEALESAGYSPDQQPGRTGVFAGMSMNTYLLSNIYGHLAHVASVESLQASIGNDKDSLTTEVAYRLNLTGPAVTVQSSSSTSLTAIHYACQSLLSCECDMALAGGVSIHFPEKAGYMYYEGGTTSPDGHCRAFDEEARGFVAGHGAGVVVLRRLSDAIESGDTIYAVVRGSAVNNDGSAKVSYMAPSVEGQAEVIALAQAVAGVTPESIGYVEGHGTATPMGDPIELAALTQAFRSLTDKKGFCALGSIKSNIGHLDAAAGVSGFIKAALALYHKLIPPTLHFKKPNPALDLENSPFFVNTRLMDFPRGESPRRAGVTSLGMGGTNAHCVLEEPPAPAPAPADPPRRRTELLLLSARSETALESLTSRLRAELEARPALDLADVAYTLKAGRKRFGHRRAIVCRGLDGAMEALAGRDHERTLSSGEGQVIEGRPVMFLFSGQGAQHVDMGRGLYESEPVFQRELDACAEKLRPILGRDIRSVLYPKEDARELAAAELKQTSLTQPALFVIGYALARLFLSWGIEPRAMLGHSIGEYVAACIAGVFTLDDALSLVAARGRLMQKMPPGAMLAVSLGEAEIRPMLGADLSIAVLNSQTSTVVAGPLGAIDAFARELEERGIAATRLLTSHAFHSAMMDPVLDAFRAEVARVECRPPQLPILSNVTGTWMTAEEATSPDYWARQLRGTVRFADGLDELLEEPDALVVELGPGQKLVALAAEHPKKGPSHVLLGAMRHPRAQQADDEHFSTVLGWMFLSGVEPDWSAFYDGERRRRVALPTYPFERQRHWVEPRAIETRGSSADQKLEVAKWFYLPAWRRALAPQKGAWARDKARYWLFVSPVEGKNNLSARMEQRLVEAGYELLTITPGERSEQTSERSWTLRPDDEHAYAALLEQECAMGRAPDHLVHLWLASFKDEEGTALDRGVHSLLLLAKAIARQKRPPRSLVVVAGQMQSLAGELPCPAHAAVIGPCRVIQQEIPSIACRAVDIAWPLPTSSDVDLLVDRLLGESVTVDPSLAVVAYRGVQRWAQAHEAFACPPVPETTPVREGGVYLVLGGLGQLGHSHARALARHGRAIKLVLAARSALPDREAWDDWLAKEGASDPTSRKIRKIRELEALGAEVMVRRADVAKEAELSAVIQETLSRFGALHGVVFAAGTVDRSLFRGLLELQIEEVRSYFRVRADGLRALEAALGDHPLDFCVVASSLASVLGGLGLFGYSAATSFMDAFVERRAERAGTPWMSVSWDAWLPEVEDGSAPGGQTPFGDLAISEDEGEDAFLRLLGMGGASHIVVSTSDLRARAARWARPELEKGTNEEPRMEASREPRRAQSKAFVAPRDELESRIARLWEAMLGIAEVGIHDNFFDVGGNSLVGVKLIARLREELSLSIPAVALYESPTVEALARMIRASQGVEPDEKRADEDESQARGERRRARQGRRVGRASGDDEDS